MKPVVRLALTAAAVSMAFGVASAAFAATPNLKSQKAKDSYMVGMSMAINLPTPVVEELDPAIVANAVEAILKGEKPALSEEEYKSVRESFGKRMSTKMQALEKKVAAANKKKGAAFLAENKTKPGVHVTDSGLQYKVIKQGNGPKPKKTDTVQVNYEGSMLDGTVFDSSYKRGTPATFPLSGVIKGWSEALQLMPVGSTYVFWIPADIAYGSRGAGPIPPESTLKFKVELLKIMPPKSDDDSSK
ncbi:MAG TPA: FKBP-type peptidyl-prolyl cis-trans isomerase [Rhodanobacteraceae bacterium]|nr:FKBP-type peptidyl-prolyl cis-trans isomerase [Rhodanobacteraceae bacterium]